MANTASLKPSKQVKEKGGSKPKSANKKREPQKADHECACGCGKMVKGTFKQGHDSKYYSMLKKVSKGEVSFTDLPKLVQRELKNKGGVTVRLKKSGH